MPPPNMRETIVVVSNDKAFFYSVALATKHAYVIQFCNDSTASVDKYFKCFGAKRCHAIVIDVDPFNGSASCQENGASLVKHIRFELGIDAPILVLCFENLNTPHNNSKHSILKRAGQYLLQYPFLLSTLKKMLLDGRKCDLPHEVKCSIIEEYGVFVKHEFMDKLDWRLKRPEELKQLWAKTGMVYSELGGFDSEIASMDKSMKILDKKAIILAVKRLLKTGTIWSSRRND